MQDSPLKNQPNSHPTHRPTSKYTAWNFFLKSFKDSPNFVTIFFPAAKQVILESSIVYEKFYNF